MIPYDPDMFPEDAYGRLIQLLTCYRDGTKKRSVGITEVFLAALGTEGRSGFQVELGFGDTTTKSFQADTLAKAVDIAYSWTEENYR